MPTSTRIINQENLLTSMSKRTERPLDCFGFKLSKGFPLSEVKGGLYGRAKYFWIVFTVKLKRNNLRHELKKYMLKRALISL
jgi:hypothetical protein